MCLLKSFKTEHWLSVEQSTLTAWEKSAEGIVVEETSPDGEAEKQGRLTRRRPERYVRGSKGYF